MAARGGSSRRRLSLCRSKCDFEAPFTWRRTASTAAAVGCVLAQLLFCPTYWTLGGLQPHLAEACESQAGDRLDAGRKSTQK